ncbi:hypothetical protein KA183_13105 [bacterium]|nr:hypothetical protein [bacterium]QQR57767.1 MAG: hypothetical protein IPG59_22815 [Candidatus Melainabacteria bacterium]
MSRHRYLNMKKLLSQEDLGLCIAWMLAAHDMENATQIQTTVRAENPNRQIAKEEIQSGCFMLSRLYCAQVSEAMRLVEPSSKSDGILTLLKSDKSALNALTKLNELDKEDSTKKLLERIRNKGTFHFYDWREKKLPVWFTEAVHNLADSDFSIQKIVISDNKVVKQTYIDTIFADVFAKKILQIEEDVEKLGIELVKKKVKAIMQMADGILTVSEAIAYRLYERAQC